MLDATVRRITVLLADVYRQVDVVHGELGTLAVFILLLISVFTTRSSVLRCSVGSSNFHPRFSETFFASFMSLIYNLKEEYLSNQVLWHYVGPELGFYLRCWLLVWKWRLSVNFKLNWFCIISTLISKFLVCWVKSALQFLGSFLDFNFSWESEVLLRKSYIIPGTKKLPEAQQWHWWQSVQIPTPTPVWRWAVREAIGAKLGINGSVSVCKQLL